MKKFIVLILFLGCHKNIKNLAPKNKIGEIYWQYIKEDRDDELKEYLDKNNFNLNEVLNEEGETLLTLAVKFNSFNALKILLERNDIEVDKKNIKMQTPLIAAILEGEDGLERDEIIDKLLEKGANTNEFYGLAGNNTLMICIIREEPSLVNKILASNIDINEKNLFGETALMLLIKSNIDEDKKLEIMNKILKRKDIDINVQDEEGKDASTSYGY